MKNKILYIVFVLFSINTFAQKSLTEQYLLIGNNTSFSQVTSKHLIQIFKAKYSRWSNGEQVTIVLPSPTSEVAKSVANNIYNTTVKGVQKFWLSQVFQGRGFPPVFLDTDDEIINYIIKTPGAIGLIKYREAFPNKSIIISID